MTIHHDVGERWSNCFKESYVHRLCDNSNFNFIVFRNLRSDYIQFGSLFDVIKSTPYCGNRPQFALIAEVNITNFAGMLFRSDGGFQEQGFNASYFAVGTTPKICK